MTLAIFHEVDITAFGPDGKPAMHQVGACRECGCPISGGETVVIFGSEIYCCDSCVRTDYDRRAEWLELHATKPRNSAA